jgi:hypothetical protein
MPSLLLVKGEGCRHTFLQCVSPLLAKPAHRLTDPWCSLSLGVVAEESGAAHFGFGGAVAVVAWVRLLYLWQLVLVEAAGYLPQ